MIIIEDRQQEHEERLRGVESSLSGLASLPDKLEKISEQLGDLIRADVRIKHLEAEQVKIEDDVDKLKAQIAKWAGAITALGGLGAAVQHFLG